MDFHTSYENSFTVVSLIGMPYVKGYLKSIIFSSEYLSIKEEFFLHKIPYYIKLYAYILFIEKQYYFI